MSQRAKSREILQTGETINREASDKNCDVDTQNFRYHGGTTSRSIEAPSTANSPST